MHEPVTIVCPPGYEAKDLAICLLRKDAGLKAANAQIGAIDAILAGAEEAAGQ